MTITAQYRNISYDEIRRHHANIPASPRGQAQWEALRGKAVTIQTPPLGPVEGRQACGARWFLVVDGPDMPACVCTHLVEIGD